MCVAGYEGNGTYCKGKNTQAHKSTDMLHRYQICSFHSSSFVSQSLICAAGPMVDVQSLPSAQRSRQERGPVVVEKATLEMGSSVWVCTQLNTTLFILLGTFNSR